jgi:hypothetical protein
LGEAVLENVGLAGLTCRLDNKRASRLKLAVRSRGELAEKSKKIGDNTGKLNFARSIYEFAPPIQEEAVGGRMRHLI